ncbi:MAG TPA: hypothetical protein VFA53_00980 [Xanthobacteraceae bacterium]|nr:hypothetical protein [Xanthobacteraceae bacterium]
MHNLKMILRWIAAIVAAILIYFIALGAIAFAWAKLGFDPGSAYKMMIEISTLLAVIAGSIIVPRHQWKIAFGALGALALLVPVWFFARAAVVGKLTAVNVTDVGYTLVGLIVAYFGLRAGKASAAKLRPAAGVSAAAVESHRHLR